MLRPSDLKARSGGSCLRGAIHASASIAGQCNRVSGQELIRGEEKLRGGLVSAAKERELQAWGSSRFFIH